MVPEGTNAQSAINVAKTILFENFIYGSLSSWPELEELQEDSEILEIHAIVPIQVSRRVEIGLSAARAKSLPQGLEVAVVNHAVGVDVCQRGSALCHGRIGQGADVLQEQVSAQEEGLSIRAQGRIGQIHSPDELSLRLDGRNRRAEPGVRHRWNFRSDCGVVFELLVTLGEVIGDHI